MKLLLITNLPKYSESRYTEPDVVCLLSKFGFQDNDNNIYILPQKRMAFVLMSSFRSVKRVVMASKRNPIFLKGSRLWLRIPTIKCMTSPFMVYKCLMKFIKFEVNNNEQVVYIQNISQSESERLRRALRGIQCVRNFLPLLNKVFVEFETPRDTDRLGVWYSLLQRTPDINVYRMGVPEGDHTALPPRLAAAAMPDSGDIIAGAVVPTTNFGVPPDSIPPFWVTMTAVPHVFPTASPWFIIPNFVTVKERKNVWASYKAARTSTVMLTGLPKGNYSHEDVARLVWRYIPQKTLYSLYYSIIVLPLQRRAFVDFHDWKACQSFVADQCAAPVSVQGCVLSVHCVLDAVLTGSSEETMYRALMRWSNARVPELESLEERLLCVEVTETSVSFIIVVVTAVASIAAFLSFLPLANRICIEMADSSGVAEVVNNLSQLMTPSDQTKVRHVESLKSRKQRLQDLNKVVTNLDRDGGAFTPEASAVTAPAKPRPPAPAEPPPAPEPALQTTSPGSADTPASHGSTSSEPAAGPRPTPGSATETNADTTPDPKDTRTEEHLEEPEAEKRNAASSVSAASENLTNAAGDSQKLEAEVQESVVVPDDTSEAVETKRDLSDPDVEQQAGCSQADAEEKEVKEALELEETEMTEPMEADSSALSPPQRPPTAVTAPHTSGNTSSQIQKIMKPESPAQESETKTKAPHLQHQPGGSSAAAQKFKVETETKQKDLLETRDDPASTGVSKVSALPAEVTASAKSKPSKTPSETNGRPAETPSSAADIRPTPGETLDCGLIFHKGNCVPWRIMRSSEIFSWSPKLLYLSDLPKYKQGCYSEADIAGVLRQFQVQCNEDKIFVFPHARKALVLFPTVKDLQDAFKTLIQKHLTLDGGKLCIGALSTQCLDTPFGFYKSLMSMVQFKTSDDGTSVIYIKNISQSEFLDLRKALSRIGAVRNFLPLLNKVFIEFESARHADRLGLWYSFLSRRLAHDVHRAQIPRNKPTLLPLLAAKALPDSELSVSGAVVPRAKSGIPPGTTPPFWVTMTTSPYMFPTASPWFNIPVFQTVSKSSIADIQRSPPPETAFSTAMLTGLPAEGYLDEDVAKLVWDYFPDRPSALHSMTVLPLQRRAFVFFHNWDACCRFFLHHSRRPVSVKGNTLNVHLVLEEMQPGSCEESYYRSVMRWSNAPVAERPSLEERLLCLEASGVTVGLATAVMREVASVAAFVSFLPLGNKIYVEMFDSGAAAKVEERLSSSTRKSVGRVESLKSRKQRLHCWKNPTDATDVHEELQAPGGGATPPPEEGRGPAPTTGTPDSAGPEASAGSDVRDSDVRDSDVRDSDVRDSDVRDSDVRDSDVRDSDVRDSDVRDSDVRDSVTEAPSPCEAEMTEKPGAEINMDSVTTPQTTEERTERTEGLRASGEKMEGSEERTEGPLITDERTEGPQTSEERTNGPRITEERTDGSEKKTEGPLITEDKLEEPRATEETAAELPLMDEESFSVLKAALLEYRLTRGRTEEDGEETPPDKHPELDLETINVQDDGKDDASAVIDWVDEVVADEDADESSSSFGRNRGEKREKQTPGVSSGAEKTSTPGSSLKDETLKEMKKSKHGSGCRETKGDSPEDRTDEQMEKEKNQGPEDQTPGGSAVKPDQSTKTFHVEERENSPDHEMPATPGAAGEGKETGEPLHDVEDETCSAGRPVRRRSARGLGGNGKILQDSVVIMTRAARATRERTDRNASDERKEKKTPPGRRRPAGRGSGELNGDQDGDQDRPTPARTRAAVARDAGEETTPARRGRPPKRLRPTPGKKPTKGKKESPDSREGCAEEEEAEGARSHGSDVQETELGEPEVKRSHQSPAAATDLNLPPFNPRTPLGREFLVPRWGFFCKICSVPYLKDDAAEDRHCRSQEHQDNLQKYYQKSSRTATQNSPGSACD
ncbi:uncharacterized protein LOC133420866 [Cololabis saira]|uniref:uncharacterized protein LOC133420866 n=1 Tax=Cololabis saira TaxID=129043 RepID=UPI002AD558D4|nr:uncharacterized protein LOC133420866 [Cololabis saira]